MKKREREGEEDGPPQGKRAAGLARGGESSEAAGNSHAGANGGQQRLTTDDALTYLKDVKEKFKDDKEKYSEFLEVMKDFKAQRVDTAGVITRVKDLFKGHRHLILGFNAFLPPGFEITLPAVVEEEKKQPAVEFDQAINYVNKIKARFHADEHVYKAFLEILNMYRKGNKNINEVYQEVALLFADHSDLLQEFTYFLPGTNGATSHPIAKPVQQQRPRQRDEVAFGGTGKAVSGGLLIAKKEKIVGLPSERGRDRETERRAEKSRKVGERVDKKDIGDRKEAGDREEGGRDKDKDFAEQKPKRVSARNASDAIRRQSQAGEGGEGIFSGLPALQASTDETKVVKGATLQYPIFDKVKSRLRNRDTYQEFLKCLNIFSQEIISRVELQSLVGDILGKHTDLLEGFNEFLTHCENVEGYLAGVFSERKLGAGLGDFIEGAPLKAVKTERDTERDRNREKDNRERDRERDRERKKEREREKEKIREKIRDREREKEKLRERERDVKERSERDVKPTTHVATHKITSQKDKFVNKPISELDLSNCERCTPSYRLLPKQYPKPVSSHRTALGMSVLNDNWVSVTSGSEDYSFKNSRKNQYEESLFRCEDDRYELDMLLETTAATAKLVGQYTQKQEGAENGKAETLPPVEEFLSPIHLRCIERIYGDHGLDILEVLKKSTSRAMPVIHSRLVQKEEEWTKCREDMNKVWSEVYTKNVYKALDHRSFYFKQQDKKALSTKGLLAEIKELNEKRRREDGTMLAIAAGNRRPLLPDLRHEFGDPSIHNDLYQIIRYSSEEISSSPEHMKKTMRSLRTVLAPMLGISPRLHFYEDMEEVTSDGKGGMESGGGSEGDETSSREGGGLGSENEEGIPNVGMDPPRAVRISGGTNEDAGGGERNNIGECLVLAENADTGFVGDYRGSEEGNEVGDAEQGTAARTEGSGWLHAQNSERSKPSSLAGGERSELESRLVNDGLVVTNGNGSGVRDAVDREEGELSPSSEQEDRNKVKYTGLEENGVVKISDDHNNEVDAEGVVLTEMDHDQDANDKGEVSGQKSSGDSDNPSEVADESSASEQSSDEQSEHEEEEDEQEEKVESEGEAEGMDDGDEDGNSSLATPEYTYAHCKPLAVHPASATTALVVGSHSKTAGRVFYGNDVSYILSRLYQILYERILSAKVNAELAAKKKCSDGGAAPNLYSSFMQVLYGLLNGSLDNLKFEDECRAIIGTQSYVLFTLDKLIFKLVKQLQAAATDDGVQKLLALHAYEYEREAVDLVYYADACVVLHDESIYRFEHRSNPTELLIQLMENSEKLDFAGNALGSSFQKYLDGFTKSAPTRKNQIIRRILKRQYAGEEHDVVIERALLSSKVVNGLENKISCDTFKVSYVLDTEDFLFRCTARRSHEHKQKLEFKKQQLFGAWLDRRRRELSDSASESLFSRME